MLLSSNYLIILTRLLPYFHVKIVTADMDRHELTLQFYLKPFIYSGLLIKRCNSF